MSVDYTHSFSRFFLSLNDSESIFHHSFTQRDWSQSHKILIIVIIITVLVALRRFYKKNYFLFWCWFFDFFFFFCIIIPLHLPHSFNFIHLIQSSSTWTKSLNSAVFLLLSNSYSIIHSNETRGSGWDEPPLRVWK